ncbi:MAG: hypothetical protein NT061_08620 [Spirochaetes bacterium]|nr:hypothetical protein [Spirochaetota bacterium]
MKRLRPSAFALILILILLPGCALFQEAATGTLVLRFQLHESITPKSLSDGGKARSIVPSVPWLPQSYLISGTGPDGAAFSLDSAKTSLKQRLVPGSWTIEVRALSSNATTVASGTMSCVLEPNLSTQAQITLCPVEGKGTLTLSIELNLAVSADCNIFGTLTYIGLPGRTDPPAQSPLEFSIPTSDPRICYSGLEAGQYTLALSLVNGQGSAVGGCFETILILAGYDTIGTCLIELGMPEIDLEATLLSYGPLEAPILSVPCLVSNLRSFRPIARSAPRKVNQAPVTKAWYIGGVESADAISLLSDQCIALPSDLFIMDHSLAADGLNGARFDFVETCDAESRVGSASTSAEQRDAFAKGGFTWWASFNSNIMKAPALSGIQDTCSGTPPSYRVKAVAGSPSGLVVISGLDEEAAIHTLAAPYGAALGSISNQNTVPLNTSWIRLWKDKVKVGGTAKTADRLAVSRDGQYIAAASSLSNWLRLYNLGYGGEIIRTSDATSLTPGFEGMDNIKALCFFQEGSNERLFALCSSSKSVLIFDVSPQGLTLLAKIALDSSDDLSLQDLQVLDSGEVVVSASTASKIYILGDGGSGYGIVTTISRSGGSGPYHPGPLAASPSTGGFYVLCDKSSILRYEPSGGFAFTLTQTIPLSTGSIGATTLSAGRDPAGARDLLFAAGGETIEFINPQMLNPLLDEIDLEPNPSQTDGIATAEGSCYVRGGFILGGGLSGSVSVFGPE